MGAWNGTIKAFGFMPGTLFVVATPIGNLEDITLRALAVLKRVSVIAAEDTRHTARLLTRYAIETPTTSLHEHNEHRKSPLIVARLAAGDDVALVSDAGTPAVSDPGARLIRAAIETGIRVEPVPGPSAVISALIASGLPVDTFTFLGFPPTRSRARVSWFDEVRRAGRTVVFFEAPHRIIRTLRDLQANVGDRPIAVARELTKKHEELVRGPISAVLAGLQKPIGEFTVVLDIGHKTDTKTSPEVSGAELLSDIGRMTDKSPGRRRLAIAELARRHGRSPNEIYTAIERAKKSTE
jgi:16S rRNA (cytidine1402-2'-O)-methyltransferase